MIRINMNIAIVDMIDMSYKSSLKKTPTSECIDPIFIRNDSVMLNVSSTVSIKKTSLERKLLDALKVRRVFESRIIW